VRHVRLKTQSLRAIDCFEQFQHVPPAVHAAPTDFAFGCEPLSMRLCDGACFPERLGDPACVLRRRLKPGSRAGGGIEPDHAVRSNAVIPQHPSNATGFLDLPQKLTALVA